MKMWVRSLAIAVLIVSAGGSAWSQETSELASFLAYHCAKSSGNSAEGYADYANRLAKTLEALSPEQQARVLGFEVSRHDSINPAGKLNSSGGRGPNELIDSGEEPSLLDRLKGWLGL